MSAHDAYVTLFWFLLAFTVIAALMVVWSGIDALDVGNDDDFHDPAPACIVGGVFAFITFIGCCCLYNMVPRI